MIVFAQTREAERAVKAAHAERGKVVAKMWHGLISIRPKFFLSAKPQVSPAG